MFPERESFGGEAARISSKRLPVLRTTSQQSLKSSRYSSKKQMSSVEFVFFLFLLVRLFDLLKACEIFRHFLQFSQSKAEFHAFFWRLSCGTDVILLAPTSICQIWSRLAGYEPLAGGLEQIKNGEKF